MARSSQIPHPYSASLLLSNTEEEGEGSEIHNPWDHACRFARFRISSFARGLCLNYVC